MFTIMLRYNKCFLFFFIVSTARNKHWATAFLNVMYANLIVFDIGRSITEHV